jgi:hypothetical protein
LCPVRDVETEFVQVTVTEPSPAVPATLLAAAGRVDASSGADAVEHPPAEQAFNVNEYPVPEDNPEFVYASVEELSDEETRVAPRRSS